jgi:hypothetical protein
MNARLLQCAALLCAVSAAALPAAAATSFDFLFNAQHTSDDGQLFLNLTVGSYQAPRPALEPVLPRLRYLDEDLPVVLFLADGSHRSAEFIVNLRSRGLSWSVVFERVRVPMDVLFVGIDRDPGPPYGKAWGYWRKRGKNVRLVDDDVRALVRVQIGSRITGIPVYELARQCEGRTVPIVVADNRGRPWKPKSAEMGPDQRGVPPGHGGVPPGHGGVPPGQAKKGQD